MRWTNALKFLLASLLPVTVLVVAAELALRAFDLDEPHLATPLVTPGMELVHQEDDELFFALRPNLDVRWQDVRVVTNALGLRSAEIGPKQPDEFRILSLGESTTFGARVEGDETYSALLERELQARSDAYRYRVINAGVSAYTSFQSLRFLEQRGFALEPDLVLFYHELNDYLPSSIRAGGLLDESGLALTDRELYESVRHSIARKLLARSAIYRFLTFRLARSRIESLQTKDLLPVEDFLQPEKQGRVYTVSGMQSLRLPPRVTLEERRENLRTLLALCRQHDVGLLVIHPSYARSSWHECALTEFCAAEGLPMFEAFDVLHPPGVRETELFADPIHPNAEGHAALARRLAPFLIEWGLVPTRPRPSDSRTPDSGH